MERNVPKLRFKGFNDEWEEKKLDNFLKESRIPGSSGSNAKKLTVKLWAKGIVPKKEIYEGSDNTKYYIRKAGQLMYGKLDFLNCAFGIVPNELDGYESTIDAPAFDISGINSYFLYNRIIQKSFYKKNGDIADGSRKAKRIHADVFLNMSIKIPSLQEQERIANFLTKVDKIIEKQDEKVKNLEKYKKGMMQKIFSQEIRFKDENENEYPEWEEKKLGEIAGVIMGQSPSSEAYNENYEGIPLIQGNADIKLRKTAPRIYTTEITKTCEIGDIIMSVRAPVGSIGIADHNCCIGRGVCAIKAKINNNYLYQVLLKKENKWSSISQGSTFESINKNDINGLKIVVPSLKEQEKIADFLTKIDLSSQKEYDKLKELKQWKRGLLQQMFV